jgi:UDP-glucose 4-epimerase
VKRALVTGGTGFLGVHLVGALCDRGDRVTVLVRASSDLDRLRERLGNLDRVELRPVDLLGPGLDEEFARAQAEVVFHLAGDGRSRAAPEQEATMARVHVEATRAVASAAIRAKAGRFVALSTSDVYGGTPSPHDAEGALFPKTPYSKTKAAGEEVLRSLHREQGLDVVILRPYLVYGPWQPPRQLVSGVIHACLDEKPLPMTDGLQRRDFVHAHDVVRAMILAADAPKARGHVIDICTGIPVKVQDVAHAIVKLIGPASGGPILGAILRPVEEGLDHFGDPARARALIGWEPSMSLEEGLASTVEFERARRCSS